MYRYTPGRKIPVEHPRSASRFARVELINIYIYIYIYTHIHIGIYMNAYIYIYVYVCMYVCVCIYIYIYIFPVRSERAVSHEPSSCRSPSPGHKISPRSYCARWRAIKVCGNIHVLRLSRHVTLITILVSTMFKSQTNIVSVNKHMFSNCFGCW